MAVIEWQIMHGLVANREPEKEGLMAVDLSLEGMTVADKLRLLETLWADLSRQPENVAAPAWHGEILGRRIQAVRDGRTKFEDWDEVKRRLQARVE